MRILIAVDGSPSSAFARDLVASIAWPAASHLRVVSALEIGGALFGAPWYAVAPANADELESRYLRESERLVSDWTTGLARPDRQTSSAVIRGRAATSVIEEARRFGADLVVVGSRGHGGLETMLLGSVSAEIVDHASCPVLVARRDRVRSLLMADDGSAGARAAAEKLVRWSAFTGLPVTVLSVVGVTVPWEPPYATKYDPGDGDYLNQSREANLEAHRRIAEDTAARLRTAGCEATAEVRTGHAANEIVMAARDLDVDLVVVGTRGHTGLARLLLGSVARNVLTHVLCSVLVVRERAAARQASASADAPPAVEEPVGFRG